MSLIPNGSQIPLLLAFAPFSLLGAEEFLLNVSNELNLSSILVDNNGPISIVNAIILNGLASGIDYILENGCDEADCALSEGLLWLSSASHAPPNLKHSLIKGK